MTDLCSVCQQNSTALMRAANLAEEDKSEVSHNNIATFKTHTFISGGEAHGAALDPGNGGKEPHEESGGCHKRGTQ